MDEPCTEPAPQGTAAEINPLSYSQRTANWLMQLF